MRSLHQRSKIWLPLLSVTAAISLGYSRISFAQQLVPGDILSADAVAPCAPTQHSACGQLYVINRQSGSTTRQVFHPEKGPLGSNVEGITYVPGTLASAPTILMVDGNGGTGQRGSLTQIDPTTGTRQVLSDFGVGDSKTLGLYPIAVYARPLLSLLGLGLLPPTDYWVVDAMAGTNNLGALFSVRRTDNSRRLVSDFGDTSQGPLGAYPNSIVARTSLLGALLDNYLYMTDASAGTNTHGAIFKVNTIDGTRQLVADLGQPVGTCPVDPSPLSGPVAIAVAPLGVTNVGKLYVLNSNAGRLGKGVLLEINPDSQPVSCKVVHDFSDDANSIPPLAAGFQPGALEWELNGSGTPTNKLLVQDGDGGTNHLGILVEVDSTSGATTILNDFGVGAPQGYLPIGLAVVR